MKPLQQVGLLVALFCLGSAGCSATPDNDDGTIAVMRFSTPGPQDRSTTPTPPDDAPQAPVEPPRAECAPDGPRLWHNLAGLELDPPSAAVPPRIELPEGITAPPVLPFVRGECQEVSGLGKLASPDRELRFCCVRGRPARDGRLSRGCMMPMACRYEHDDGTAGTPTELAELLGPIDSGAKALGIVVLLHPEVLDLARFNPGNPSPYNFQGYNEPDTPRGFAIESHEDGFIVRAPAYATCGCSHHLVRLSFMVSRIGCVSVLDDPPEPIAWSRGLCVD